MKMKPSVVIGLAALFFASSLIAQPLTEEQLTNILNHPDRPTEDAKRDAARKPAKIMAFTQVTPGDHVLDLFAGAGWYTELFARAVGEDGKVYAQNDEVIWRFAEKGITERTMDGRLPNVQRFDSVAIKDITIPEGTVDIVFTALNYHDLFFTEFPRDGQMVKVRDDVVDVKQALATVHKAMRSDGVFIIIDHFGHPGSGYEAANTVHRIDPDIVKYQMEQAGFMLAEEAFYLRNKNDDLNKNVFDASVRGKTDRFIYKYVKK